MAEILFAANDLITNGSSVGKVLNRVDRDPRWKCSGYRIQNIGLEEFGGNIGQTSFLADYLAPGWRKIPFEWTPVVGGSLEERYAWVAGYTRLSRQLRKKVD